MYRFVKNIYLALNLIKNKYIYTYKLIGLYYYNVYIHNLFVFK